MYGAGNDERHGAIGAAGNAEAEAALEKKYLLNDDVRVVVCHLPEMQQYLQQQRQNGGPVHLTFEISGEAGYRYAGRRC